MGTITSDRPQASYPCGQQDLYTIAENGWTSYGEHLAVFASKKTTYTAQKGLDALAAVQTAKLLPDEGAREAQHILLRQDVVALSGDCRILWEELDSLIRDSFAEGQYETRRNEAGHDYYARASNEDWEGVKGLMTAGNSFITAHAAALTTGGMPAGFALSFSDADVDFNAKYLEFTQSEELSKTLTDQKILANNAIHAALMAMFEDGKRYFRFDASIREQFTFDTLWALIGGGAGGGVTVGNSMKFFGLVTDANGNPIVGANVRVSNPEGFIEVQTGVGGGFSVVVEGVTTPTSATLTAEIAGKMPSSRPVTIVAGVNQEQNFQLFDIPVPPTP